MISNSVIFAEIVGVVILFIIPLITKIPYSFVISVAIALMLFGHISAHFNPLYSFMVYVQGDIGTVDLFMYWGCHVIGGMIVLVLVELWKYVMKQQKINY